LDSIFQQATVAGLEMGNHASDLHLKDTPEARAIIAAWEAETGMSKSATYFTSDIDNTRWIDLPFAYDPFWGKQANAQQETP